MIATTVVDERLAFRALLDDKQKEQFDLIEREDVFMVDVTVDEWVIRFYRPTSFGGWEVRLRDYTGRDRCMQGFTRQSGRTQLLNRGEPFVVAIAFFNMIKANSGWIRNNAG